MVRAYKPTTLREKVSVVGGAALGALIPITFFRYLDFSEVNYQNSGFLGELAAWGAAVVSSTPFNLLGGAIGLPFGFASAAELRNLRINKERARARAGAVE